MLVAMIMSGARRWAYLAFLTTVTSILGAFLGYIIGFAFFDLVGKELISFYGFQEEFLVVQQSFNSNAFWALFISAFTPIPYKIFTIASGLFHIDLIMFTFASVLGRGLRFFGVSFLTHMFGERALKLVLRHLNIATAILVVLVVFYFLIF